MDAAKVDAEQLSHYIHDAWRYMCSEGGPRGPPGSQQSPLQLTRSFMRTPARPAVAAPPMVVTSSSFIYPPTMTGRYPPVQPPVMLFPGATMPRLATPSVRPPRGFFAHPDDPQAILASMRPRMPAPPTGRQIARY